jgi:hypothetical protein
VERADVEGDHVARLRRQGHDGHADVLRRQLCADRGGGPRREARQSLAEGLARRACARDPRPQGSLLSGALQTFCVAIQNVSSPYSGTGNISGAPERE